MQISLGPGGLEIVDEPLGITLGRGLPALDLTPAEGRRVRWAVASLAPTGAGDGWAAERADLGVTIELACGRDEGGGALRARVRNVGVGEVTLHRFDLARTAHLRVGTDPRRWRILRNGYQSWAATTTIGVDERDRDVPTWLGRLGVTDGRHPSPKGPGHVRSDSFSAVVDQESGSALAIGFTSLGDAFSFVEVQAPHGAMHSLALWVDLDDTPLAPGEASPWFEVRFATAADGSEALREVVEAAGAAMGAIRSAGEGRTAHPAGWCSWYYYFTKVTEADVMKNLEVLAADGRDGPRFGCEYVMVDDGHQTAIGDWLSTNDKFPSGMAAVAGRITDAGFDAGIWWAPFIVSARSQVAHDHPDWLVRNANGRRTLGLFNPGWGPAPMWVLDTTNPEAWEHIRHVSSVISQEWGYRIQKIDFLFAAAHPGVRHDRTATRAQALRRGLEAVRAGAGPAGFVLGCGSPLGPAVGLVDAMRIGADVTPSWTSLIGRTVGRDRHGLATAHALLNTMTRSVLDGAWFLNDPDCLMVRDTDTKLTEAEVITMCTIFGLTDGMIVLSDRMDRVPPARQALIARTHDLAGGRPTIVDLFAGPLPTTIVSRHRDHIDVGIVNLGATPLSGVVDLASAGVLAEVDPTALAAAGLSEFWTTAPVTIAGDRIDLGPIVPHAAKVVRLARA